MILENCHKSKRNLSTAWIDYSKAFDSVSHEWILTTLQLYKSHLQYLIFFKALWRNGKHAFFSHTTTALASPIFFTSSEEFSKEGLSPLLFSMAFIPLSNELNNTEYGYTIFNSKVNHLFYMDDLKLFPRNDNELKGLLASAKEFSNDIGMTFGLEKCA